MPAFNTIDDILGDLRQGKMAVIMDDEDRENEGDLIMAAECVRPEDVNFDLANRLLRTKHESWSYEQELRLFVQLNDPPDANGLRWFDFGPNLELKEVVVGAQCDSKDIEAVKDVLTGYGRTVECSWAYMRKDAFLLVRHDFMPPWFSPPA